MRQAILDTKKRRHRACALLFSFPENYFLAGADWVVLTPERTEWSEALARASRMVRPMEVSMKTMGRVGGELGQEVGRAARSKGGLRTLAAEGSGEIGGLALLQEGRLR